MGLLSGKSALVTGASHGIGREIALLFAKEGANLILNYLDSYDRNRSILEIEELVKELTAFGVEVVAIEGDVSEVNIVEKIFLTGEKHFGGLDSVVNNAGFIELSSTVEMPIDLWDRTIAVHLRGTFLVSRRALPYMLSKQSGSIINMASQIGQIGRAEFSHYAAAKAGIIGFTKSLAREVSNQGVRANCIAPGPITTGIVAPKVGAPPPDYLKSLPLGRAGIASEVAPTALFLASDASALYVGQTLCPNSGDVM